ncbi:MAG: SMC-Scp complex subunit ScpB [Candidatus Omnitrophica bacterium]|nr:SMC-Scp complex subunit ScpB [Candidatus Omnitrophota bacterium]
MTDTEAKAIIEAALFAAEKPLTISELRSAVEEYGENQIQDLALQLQSECVALGRGVRLVEVAGGWQVVTDPALAQVLGRIYRKVRPARLSRPGMETLAIIAYRQPITKSEIEEIRGVDVDGVLKSLLERSIVQIVGRKEGVGRPLLYGTTEVFLERFGLKSLEHLPSISELQATLQAHEAQRPEGVPVGQGMVQDHLTQGQNETTQTTQTTQTTDRPD